jgi:hypothetical protein
MKHEIKDLLKAQGRQYDVYEYATLFEQVYIAEQAIKDGGKYTTPHYSLLRSVTISAKKFAGATKHEAGFYYLIH